MTMTLFVWACQTCGCRWRDNLDGTVSLLDAQQHSCRECEESTPRACRPMTVDVQAVTDQLPVRPRPDPIAALVERFFFDRTLLAMSWRQCRVCLAIAEWSNGTEGPHQHHRDDCPLVELLAALRADADASQPVSHADLHVGGNDARSAHGSATKASAAR